MTTVPKEKWPLMGQLERTPIIVGFERLAAFCLEQPDHVSAHFAMRSATDVSIAIEFKDAPGIEHETESWISKIRAAKRTDNPFSSISGVELQLPYGSDQSLSPEDIRIKISYPFDGMYWHGHDPVVPLDVTRNSVGNLDEILLNGRPDNGRFHEWVGFTLAPTIVEVI